MDVFKHTVRVFQSRNIIDGLVSTYNSTLKLSHVLNTHDPNTKQWGANPNQSVILVNNGLSQAYWRYIGYQPKYGQLYANVETFFSRI